MYANMAVPWTSCLGVAAASRLLGSVMRPAFWRTSVARAATLPHADPQATPRYPDSQEKLIAQGTSLGVSTLITLA